MFEKQETCPVCGHLKHQNFHICTDYSVTGESFALVKCTNCSHVFTNPRPTHERLPTYYKSEHYISHTNKIRSITDLIYKVVRSVTLRNKEKLIRQLNKGTGTLLDFGCGTGHFLHHAHTKGWTVTGVEPDDKASKLAVRNNTSVQTHLSSIKETFDIITAWHVLEHVPDPIATLKDLRNKLNSTGHLIVAVPNHRSFDAKHFGKDWAGYDVPRHLSHFNQDSMQLLVTKCKLKITAVLPMHYDAYYVSLLSLKYQTGKMSPLGAYSIGRKSNASAKLTGEYSSLIYIIRK